MTSRTQCGGHSHPSCVTTIKAFVKPTHVWTLFSCAHVVWREFTISCFFSAVRKRLFSDRGQSDIIFASGITGWDCMARSSCFSFDDSKEYYTFREISSTDFFLRPHVGAQHVLSLPRLHIQYSSMFAVVSCFFMIAWSRLPPLQNTPLQPHVTWPPFFCESSKFLLGNAKARRSYMSLPFFVHRKSVSCCVFVVQRVWVSIMSGCCLMNNPAASVFRRVVFSNIPSIVHFQPSLVGSKIVDWELDPGSCGETDSQGCVVFCLPVCLVAFKCCGVCYRGRL